MDHEHGYVLGGKLRGRPRLWRPTPVMKPHEAEIGTISSGSYRAPVGLRRGPSRFPPGPSMAGW